MLIDAQTQQQNRSKTNYHEIGFLVDVLVILQFMNK